jgi:hypothetical protein
MAYYFKDDGTYPHLYKGMSTITPPFTLCGWFKPDDLTNNNAIITICYGSSVVVSYNLVAYGNVVGDPLRAVSSLGLASQFFSSKTPYSSGVWQHGAALFDTNYRLVYHNGVAGNESTQTQADPSPINNMKVGQHALGGYQYMKGHIAEVSVHRRLLTAGEIASLASGKSAACFPDDLYNYHKLDGSLIDEQGGPSLIIYGDVTESTHPTINYGCDKYGPKLQTI